MLDGNELKFGDLLVEKGKECNSLFMFLTYIASRSNIKLLKIPSDIYIQSAPAWKPDYESFLDSRYVRDHGFYRPILNMNYADPDVIKVHNDKANPYLDIGKWLYNCSLYYPIEKAVLNFKNGNHIKWGQAVSDRDWTQRCKDAVNKLYCTLGIDNGQDIAERYHQALLNSLPYGVVYVPEKEKSLKELAKEYNCNLDFTINWDAGKEEEKNKMKEEYSFGFRSDLGGVWHKIVIERMNNSSDVSDVYHVKVYDLSNFTAGVDNWKLRTIYNYKSWDQVSTQLMCDLYACDIHMRRNDMDRITGELDKARHNFLEHIRQKLADMDKPTAPFNAMPKIEKVIFNSPATIVKWNDGTKTVVKCQNNDEFDWEKGLAMAYVKRAFNNERTYYGLFKKNEPCINLPNSNMKYDPNLAKEVRIIVPKDLPVTGDIIIKAHDLILEECDKKWENGIDIIGQ